VLPDFERSLDFASAYLRFVVLALQRKRSGGHRPPLQFIPGENGASRETATWTLARQGERAGARESIEVKASRTSSMSLMRVASHNLSPARIELAFKV
jgi:hypothetical protein